MKYIRTKDKVITNNNVKEIDKAYFNDEIVKQTDTIEELCDEFVVIDKATNYRTVGTYPYDIILKGKEDYEIYGAIWVKGKHDEPILKSVSKMKGILPNGEIDWELL